MLNLGEYILTVLYVVFLTSRPFVEDRQNLVKSIQLFTNIWVLLHVPAHSSIEH